jgi:hypothetical protein
VDKFPNIGVVYLGSSGAGVKFTELLVKELPKHSLNLTLFSRKSEIQSRRNLKIVTIEIPSLRLLALFGIGRNRAKKRIIQEIQSAGIQTLLIPMAHPWDLSMQDELRSKGVKIIRIIHDANRHPGDLWPRDRHIKKMCDVDCAITLSRHTESQIKNFSSNTIVSCIPKLEYGSDIESVIDLDGFQNYDLVIGRQKKYQNLKSVVKWWISIPADAKQRRTLIVAGEMSLTSRLRFALATDVVLIRRWLSDGEFQSLIKRANRVICLYREASQSGIISAAQSNNTPVLASNVGGLVEQISFFGGGVVARLESPNDWLMKYYELNEVRPNALNTNSATPKFISDTLSAILQMER